MAEANEAASYIIQELMTTGSGDLMNENTTTVTNVVVSDPNTMTNVNVEQPIEGTGPTTFRLRQDFWTEELTVHLINVVKDNYHLITEESMKKVAFYKAITKYMIPVMPTITWNQVENKWKNITYRFNRYEDNRINNLGMRVKKPHGYEILQTFMDANISTDQEANHQQSYQSRAGGHQQTNATPDIIISGPPEYLSSNSDSDDERPSKRQRTGQKSKKIVSIQHYMETDNHESSQYEKNDNAMQDNDFDEDEPDECRFNGVFTDEATIQLIQMIKQNHAKVKQKGPRRIACFKEIARSLQHLMPNLSWTQVHNKWKNTRIRFLYYLQSIKNNTQPQKKKPVGYELLSSFIGNRDFNNGDVNWMRGDDAIEDGNNVSITVVNSDEEADVFTDPGGGSPLKRIKGSGSPTDDNSFSDSQDKDDDMQKPILWTRELTLKLLGLLKENFDAYCTKSRKKSFFIKAARVLSNEDQKVAPQQVDTKIKNTKSKYIRYERSKVTGSAVQRPIGLTILQDLFGDREGDEEMMDDGPKYEKNRTPVNTIDISEFLTIPPTTKDRKPGNMRFMDELELLGDELNNMEKAPTKGQYAASLKRLTQMIHINSKKMEIKLNEIRDGQEKIASALIEKNKLIRKLLDSKY